ncbi:hypothetical protein AJ80_04214 [Polytolypa hystricis UAMH7299]|uniref:Uncharacterized protein n=1 Tax=Polytolypa hystricis (strain UAMH7299) TaxID=1447883 RepID=A0A2B7YC73_POLH7|nr:hypothetical protein AJ80_04214 [Polytolypa hystricis UAMH7299]
MSAEALPISTPAFAAALKDLPLPSIYGKVLELRNSVDHLQRSNLELRQFILESPGGTDKDCEEAVVENEGVIARMEGRIEMCRVELVDVRGQKWIDELRSERDGGEGEGEGQSGEGEGQSGGGDAYDRAGVNMSDAAAASSSAAGGGQGGSLGSIQPRTQRHDVDSPASSGPTVNGHSAQPHASSSQDDVNEEDGVHL